MGKDPLPILGHRVGRKVRLDGRGKSWSHRDYHNIRLALRTGERFGPNSGFVISDTETTGTATRVKELVRCRLYRSFGTW
jgi:hypothetical protein